MPNSIIKVNGISKRYKIGQIQGYKTLRDSLSNLFRPPKSLSQTSNSLSPEGRGEGKGVKTGEGAESTDYIWALKNVSFEVQPGEVVGIIGRNGSGKSTLLKILTRITEPTEGTAELEGRVSSLLEVGTGFHPELTGRENIYLNGAILGMRKAEIDKKFDEIVDFAEMERFIDTPVKRYSSGMYVRLAFAVAAHLEPEILLVDEVLAVGDYDFQKKCLGKMGAVAREGRTILFVSHNLGAISQLCSRCILLHNGKVLINSPVQEAIGKYLFSNENFSGLITFKRPPGASRALFKFMSISISNKNGKHTNKVELRDNIQVTINYETKELITGGQIAVELWDSNGICVFCSSNQDTLNHSTEMFLPKGTHNAILTINSGILRPGRYSITIGASVPSKFNLDSVESAINFEICEDGTSPVFKLQQGRRGIVCPIFAWRSE